jgi:predicted transposase YbfD/YdcC
MIRRLLQALDAQLLTTAIAVWLADQTTSADRRAIAVDGKTLRGSRTGDHAARHVLAACDQSTGTVLASTDVDGKTNEITRFAPLLDQIGDLRDAVITADALHCQRDHVDYLAERGAHWILTVKRNQPHLHKQLSRLPWRQVPQATRTDDRGHGRREIRTLKILTVAVGIDFPHAAQALQIRRRRRRLDQPRRFTTETVYAITDLHVHQLERVRLWEQDPAGVGEHGRVQRPPQQRPCTSRREGWQFEARLLGRTAEGLARYGCPGEPFLSRVGLHLDRLRFDHLDRRR